MQHLLVDISAHGLGHVAQTSAVLNALDCAHLRLTIRSMTPESVLRRRIRHPFTLIPWQQDNGMLMHDALRVDVPASMHWYATFHANYCERKAQAARELERLQPDLLFANIPYLSLDAAGECAIPAVALCSLNWADVFHAYCSKLAGAEKIYAEIRHAYTQAEVFLQPVPSMVMHHDLRTRAIAPIAAIGQRQPELLRAKARQPDTTRFVLAALGGIGVEYPLANWPVLPGVCWIFPDAALWRQREDFLPESLFGLSYLDLLASCDAVITKTGYGTQTEAVVNQVPALCIRRGDWPEEPNLPDWHAQHGEVLFTDWQQIQVCSFGEQIMTLLETPWGKPAVSPTGAAEAASVLQARLQAL
ncbi:MAG TPA: hypothetical protein PLE99_04270 [Candidatus Thiothrix moscowensis]|uniref:hypothetical protein n=1 Tax=unclassified Thiothrix TaxID=2636184 RepID=UPI0025E4C448|nr:MULTISPECIES: hypothetical protein [unclassified Thiothrix]HRJ51962.1 hypothetical protein [Candidatus Thiothrix moscowensis]HRJ92277.1 hypothetical protein [Candidatus Thiothrix moscowensis]